MMSEKSKEQPPLVPPYQGGEIWKGRRNHKGCEEMARRWVNQTRQPFNAAGLAAGVGLEEQAAGSVLSGLVDGGIVKRISGESGGIYVRAGRYRVQTASGPGGQSFLLERVREYLGVIESHSVGSCRELGRLTGTSHHLAYMYLTAMMSVGLVDWDGSRYVVADRSRLAAVGTLYERGIVGRRKQEEAGQ